MSDQPKDQPEFEVVVDDGVEVNWPELEDGDDAEDGEGTDGSSEPDRD